MSDLRCVEIRTTVDDAEVAETMVRTLVEMRLAACAHVSAPVVSYYWWEDELERAVEHEVTVRTTPAAADAASRTLLSLHPYGLPALVVTDCTASPAYAAWVHESVDLT